MENQPKHILTELISRTMVSNHYDKLLIQEFQVFKQGWNEETESKLESFKQDQNKVRCSSFFSFQKLRNEENVVCWEKQLCISGNAKWNMWNVLETRWLGQEWKSNQKRRLATVGEFLKFLFFISEARLIFIVAFQVWKQEKTEEKWQRRL